MARKPIFKFFIGKPKNRYSFFEQIGTHDPAVKSVAAILESIDTTTKEAFAAVGRRDGSEVEILSTAVAKVPSYLQGLGYYLADAEAEAATAKDDYELLKLTKEKAVIDSQEKVNVAVAERQVGTDDELVLARDKLRKAQHNYKILKLKYDSTDRQVSAWQSRLAVVKNDMGSV